MGKKKQKKTNSTESKTINLQNTGNYYTDLATIESTNKHTKIGNGGYLELYQLGEAALTDAGYYKKEATKGQKIKYNNDWSGTWTGKNGVNSKEDFLNNRIVQDIAIREYHQINWDKYLKNYQQHEGKEINGIKLTQSGMVSCAHLVGHDKFKKFIDSKGKTDKQDGNLVPCSEYLKKFGGYEYDFSTDALQAQLQQKQAQAEQPTAPQPAPAVQPQSDTNAQSTTATQPPQDTNNTQAAPAVQQPPKPQPVAADAKAVPQHPLKLLSHNQLILKQHHNQLPQLLSLSNLSKNQLLLMIKYTKYNLMIN